MRPPPPLPRLHRNVRIKTKLAVLAVVVALATQANIHASDCVSDALLNRVKAEATDTTKSSAHRTRWLGVQNLLERKASTLTRQDIYDIYERRKNNGLSTSQWDDVVDALKCLDQEDADAENADTEVIVEPEPEDDGGNPQPQNDPDQFQGGSNKAQEPAVAEEETLDIYWLEQSPLPAGDSSNKRIINEDDQSYSAEVLVHYQHDVESEQRNDAGALVLWLCVDENQWAGHKPSDRGYFNLPGFIKVGEGDPDGIDPTFTGYRCAPAGGPGFAIRHELCTKNSLNNDGNVIAGTGNCRTSGGTGDSNISETFKIDFWYKFTLRLRDNNVVEPNLSFTDFDWIVYDGNRHYTAAERFRNIEPTYHNPSIRQGDRRRYIQTPPVSNTTIDVTRNQLPTFANGDKLTLFFEKKNTQDEIPGWNANVRIYGSTPACGGFKRQRPRLTITWKGPGLDSVGNDRSTPIPIGNGQKITLAVTGDPNHAVVSTDGYPNYNITAYLLDTYTVTEAAAKINEALTGVSGTNPFEAEADFRSRNPYEECAAGFVKRLLGPIGASKTYTLSGGRATIPATTGGFWTVNPSRPIYVKQDESTSCGTSSSHFSTYRNELPNIAVLLKQVRDVNRTKSEGTLLLPTGTEKVTKLGDISNLQSCNANQAIIIEHKVSEACASNCGSNPLSNKCIAKEVVVEDIQANGIPSNLIDVSGITVVPADAAYPGGKGIPVFKPCEGL